MKKILYASVLILIFVITFSSACFYFSRNTYSKPALASNIEEIQGANLNKDTSKDKTNPKKSQGNSSSQNYNTAGSKVSIPDKVSVAKIIKDRPLYNKEVFLTFDDGPSINTLKILKILGDYNVKATFFVVGASVDAYPGLIKAEYNEGMCILNHSYTHKYSMYKSIKACMDDFDKCNISIKNAIGIEPPPFIRFPGGSDNTVSNAKEMRDIRNTFITKGIDYVDWNTLSGDADSETVPAVTLENNSIKQLSSVNFSVNLMHDAPVKYTTVEALPIIIDYLKKQGYTFRTFNDLTPTEEKKMISDRIINRGANK